MHKMQLPLTESGVMGKINAVLSSELTSGAHQRLLRDLLAALPESEDLRGEFAADVLARGGAVLAEHPYWHGSEDAACKIVARILKVCESA